MWVPWSRRHIADEPGLSGDDAVWSNPALLLPEPAAERRLGALLQRWNPDLDLGGGTSGPVRVADEITWSGPIEVSDSARRRLSLEPTWRAGYVAMTSRQRAPSILPEAEPDETGTAPEPMPYGVEGTAWDLVRGLAARLDGAAHLPGAALRRPTLDFALVTAHGPVSLEPEDLSAALPEPPTTLALVDVERSEAGDWVAYRLEDPVGALFVEADRYPYQDRPPAVRSQRWHDSEIVAYSLGVAGTGTARDRLRYQFARALITATGGVLLDEYGFLVELAELTGAHWAAGLW